MSKTKFLISLVLAVSVLVGQAGVVFAAPAFQDSTPISGTVQSITLETDPNTAIITVIVEVVGMNQSAPQEVRLSQKTAEKLGLVLPDGDGNPVINNSALGSSIEIKRAMIIPAQEEDRHPIGNALEAFFSDIDGINYDVIMYAHENGVGFGVIAQALWLTREIGGDVTTFNALLFAKQNNNYRKLPFVILDENNIPIIPENWGQLRKAISDGNKIKKVAANQDKGSYQNYGNNPDKGKGKDKSKDKNNGNNGNNGKNSSNDNPGGESEKNKQKSK